MSFPLLLIVRVQDQPLAHITHLPVQVSTVCQVPAITVFIHIWTELPVGIPFGDGIWAECLCIASWSGSSYTFWHEFWGINPGIVYAV